ncbi:UNVERIFIED_CONTAM: hypothetical protein RMT77_018975 [Armadillidium vulgare]
MFPLNSSYFLADHLLNKKMFSENEKVVSPNPIALSPSENYEETTEEIVSFNTSSQNLVGSDCQIQIPQFQESYEEVMPKIGPSSSACSGMLADPNLQRSHLQDEKNEHQIENEKEVSPNPIALSPSENYEETTEEIVSFNTSSQNLVGSDCQIQIPQFQESYEEVMPKIGPSSSACCGMLADPNLQRSHLQDEKNEHQIENEKEVSPNPIALSPTENYEETTEEIVSFNTSSQNLVGSDCQIQIPQFQESYEEVMPKIGQSSSASSGMLVDPNPQRSPLQEEINESCWDNYEDVVPSSITSSSMLVDPNLQRSHLQDEKNEPQIENSQIRMKEKTVKPMRPCLYCKKPFTKVSQHIKRIHADEIDVKKMLSLPKEDQDKEMRKILKLGVYNYNIDLLKNGKSAEVMMLRKQNIENGVVICEKCSGTYGKSKFYLHKKKCDGGLQIVVKNKSNEDEVSEKLFKEKILSDFRKASSEVTKLCRRNPIILEYGKDQFKTIVAHPSKEESKKKKVMASMRLLARFLLKFVEIGKKKHPNICYEDFINKKNFRIVEETIFVIARNEKDQKIQHSVKLHLQAIINSLIGTLSKDYIIKEDKAKAQLLSDFKILFTQSSKALFAVAQAHVKLDRTKELRKPVLLPLEDDIKLLKNYIYKEISNIKMLNEWTKETFIKARRLSVCFLTILNARRSGEASALTIENINEARENKWVDTQRLKLSVKSSAQKSLVDNTKIAFLYGKGNRLVAVAIPAVLIPIIEKLVDPDIRTMCNIDKNNKYAFPSTGNSQGHASGWHEVSEVCTNAKLTNNITADKMRHRAATIFGGMDVSENFKNLIYEHIGHSKEIDRGIYSAPPANDTILKIVPELNNMMYLDTPANFEESSSDEGILDTQEVVHFSGAFQTLNQTTSEWENETTTENTENSLRTSQDSTSGENDSSFHKVCHKRKYNKWNIQDTETILEYFSESIGMSAIPKKEEILKFLEKFPTILPQLISTKEKSQAVRTKAMNEISKRKKRSKLFS